MTSWLREALATRGAPRDVVVSRSSRDLPMLSIPVDGGWIVAQVVIEGDGPGIPPEMIGQVFEPFFRASRARAKDIDGAGLGLTIAHEIVQRAGGSITIENGPVHGLLQIVKLPAHQIPRSGSA
jgi:signal transduction histidine kinase